MEQVALYRKPPQTFQSHWTGACLPHSAKYCTHGEDSSCLPFSADPRERVKPARILAKALNSWT